jgi:hypothetical protein
MSTPQYPADVVNPYAVGYQAVHASPPPLLAGHHSFNAAPMTDPPVTRLFALSQAQLFFLSIDCGIEPLLQWI